MKKFPLITLLICTLLAVSGCSRFDVYKIGIRQGNIITPEKVEQLELGMNKEQVTFLLGKPLVKDTFDPNRWDYFWSFKKGDEYFNQKHITLRFENEVLVSMTGDVDSKEEIDTSATDLLDTE